MSRYEVRCLKRGYKAAIGYDRPMRTYFGQIYRVSKFSNTSRLWVGSIPGEIETVEELQRLLTDYVQFDETMIARLKADKI